MFRSGGDQWRGGRGKNRFMNARGPHKFIAGKMHYDACMHVRTQDRYVTETGGEEGEKKWKKKIMGKRKRGEKRSGEDERVGGGGGEKGKG